MLIGFLAGFYPVFIVYGVYLFRPVEAFFYGIGAILWNMERALGFLMLLLMILLYIFSIVLPLRFTRGTRFDYALGFFFGFGLMFYIFLIAIAGSLP